jgi:ATP-dependent RNA helicase DDX55/SPB4
MSDRELALHGKMVPKRRNGVIAGFETKSSAVLLCTDLAARGLDFSNVQLVVQMDAPQDPKSFAHRCGRAGRAGNAGRAILFLSPGEEAYVELIRRRGVPISSWSEEEEEEDIDDKPSRLDLRSLNRADRELYEKSVVAFVSYVRFFSEHYCKYIFVFKKLDMVRLLHAFGMLHLPKMPELRESNLDGFDPDPIDPDSIPYKDEFREQQRLKRLSSSKPKALLHAATSSRPVRKRAPWSKAKEKKERNKKKGKLGKGERIDPELIKRLQRQEEKELEEDWREYKREKHRAH